jgi:hypothetical protein
VGEAIAKRSVGEFSGRRSEACLLSDHSPSVGFADTSPTGEDQTLPIVHPDVAYPPATAVL